MKQAAKKTAKQAAQEVARVDKKVEDLVDPERDGATFSLLGLIGETGDQPQLRTLSGLLAAAGLFASNRRLVRAGARMILALETATVAKNFVKDEVDRARPRDAGSASEARPRPGRSSDKEMTSFPSGHTAGAFAVAEAFSREFPEYRAPAMVAAAVIAAAQVPRSAHYVSDVAAGAVVGVAAEAASNLYWKA